MTWRRRKRRLGLELERGRWRLLLAFSRAVTRSGAGEGRASVGCRSIPALGLGLALVGCSLEPSSAILTEPEESTPSASAEATGCKSEDAEPTPRPEPAPGGCFHPQLRSVAPALGPPGSEVRIRGSGFGQEQGLSKLTFNAIEALPRFQGLRAMPGGDIVSWSDTEIVARVPLRAANEPELPAAVVVSCGIVREHTFSRVKVPIVHYVDSNESTFDIRRPGSDLDMGFWVFRMGTFGNEQMLTNDPISPCNVQRQRCRFQPGRECHSNDLEFGRFGISSSQCAGLGIPWGGQAYNQHTVKGIDVDGDGAQDLTGGVLEHPEAFGLVPELNRDLETGNFPETLWLNGADVELSDSSGYVGIRRIRDLSGQVRYGITCALCHGTDDLSGLPERLASLVSSESTSKVGRVSVSAEVQALAVPASGGEVPVPGGIPASSGGSSDGGSAAMSAAGGGTVHWEGGAEQLGPDPNHPAPPGAVHEAPVPPEVGSAGIWGLVARLFRPDVSPSERAPGVGSPVSPLGVDPNNPAPPGAPVVDRSQMRYDGRERAVAGQEQAAAGAALSPLGVDPSNPAPPGAPQEERHPVRTAAEPGLAGGGADAGAGIVSPSGSAVRGTYDGASGASRTKGAGAPSAGAGASLDVYGYGSGGKQPSPVEGGLSNRALHVGRLLANSRLVAILDEIDPLPGGLTRRQALASTGAGRVDFHGFPRLPSDLGYEAVPIPHHFGTTGFTRLLVSDRVDRSPLAEVQRRLTQQAHFDARNVGALLNGRSSHGLMLRAQEQIKAFDLLAVFLNATQPPQRLRKLLKLDASRRGVDPALVARGRALFDCHGCSGCHTPHLGRYTSLAVIPLKHIGTDPRHAYARGNVLEGEGEFIPAPVSVGALEVPVQGNTYVLEVNRVVSPALERDARDGIRPLLVRLEAIEGERVRADVRGGSLSSDGLKLLPNATGTVAEGTLRNSGLSGSQLVLRLETLELESGEKRVMLESVVLGGVLHPDGSSWGAPLQQNHLSALSGVVRRSEDDRLPVGASVQLWVSGPREDLFAGLRPEVTGDTIGYRVPKLVALRYKVGYLHDGSLKRLADLMDPERFKDEYQPSGFERIPPGYRGVPGHRFTLLEDPVEQQALLAFLETL